MTFVTLPDCELRLPQRKTVSIPYGEYDLRHFNSAVEGEVSAEVVSIPYGEYDLRHSNEKVSYPRK